MKYMLDTNICIYLINHEHKSVQDRFQSLQLGDIGISSITFAELMYGVHKSKFKTKNYEALEEFVLTLEVAYFNEESAVHYGDIRTYLEKKGNSIGALDLFIAAHARSLDAILVTNNKKEFVRVPNLLVEDWVHKH